MDDHAINKTSENILLVSMVSLDLGVSTLVNDIIDNIEQIVIKI